MNSLIKSLLSKPVKIFLRVFGLKICRMAHFPSVEDFIFQSFDNAKEVRFIQVGAHDGTHNDPICHFRNQPNWQGMLLEPNPAVYARLIKTLEGSPRCQAFNVAISEKGGVLPFYVVRNPENCKGIHFSDQVSSFDRQHVEKMLMLFGYSKEEVPKWIEEKMVETVTFFELLDRRPNWQLDLLLIDAEGADFSLLKTFPFSCQRPAVIIFEHVHLSKTEMNEVFIFITSHGYSLLKVGADVVAVLWK